MGYVRPAILKSEGERRGRERRGGMAVSDTSRLETPRFKSLHDTPRHEKSHSHCLIMTCWRRDRMMGKAADEGLTAAEQFYALAA